MYIMETGKGKKKREKLPSFQKWTWFVFYAGVVLNSFIFVSLSVRNHHLPGKLKMGMSLMPGIQGKQPLLRNHQTLSTDVPCSKIRRFPQQPSFNFTSLLHFWVDPSGGKKIQQKNGNANQYLRDAEVKCNSEGLDSKDSQPSKQIPF